MSEQVSPFSGSPQRHVPLSTKLYAPPARADLVPRPHLTERLSHGLDRRLSLICAPAGFGKTTLAIQWLKGVGRPFSWLSLDESDNDPARFLSYVVAALQQVDPTVGQTTLGLLQRGQTSPEALLTSLINDIAATPTPVILVLDDYHLIQTLSVHQALSFLVEHQAPTMHLVIISREDPPLPLPRLRARGYLVEIRQDDLRFGADEAAEFLRRATRCRLSSEDIAALHRRTEGWVAGLQLAALSLHERDNVAQFVDSFAGSNRYVLDYLIEEVFQRQPGGIRDFLLKTSILHRLTGALCDAVAERHDSRDVLLSLEKANLFIVPLDKSRRWYRYHRLFSDLLRYRLQTAAPEEITGLHRRASRWHKDHGFLDDAIDHALAASDWGEAGTLLLQVEGDLVKRGELSMLLGWLRQLPEAELRSRTTLCIALSWALILTGSPEAAEPYLEQAERIVHGKGAGHGSGSLLQDILAAQAFVARSRGDEDQTVELSRRALALLPVDNLEGRSAVAVNLGIAHWSAGHLTEAEKALREAEQAARQSQNDYALLTALGFLGAVRAAQGRLHEAADWLRQAIQAGPGSPPAALAHDTLGALLYEWNDLETAAEELDRGIELGARSGNVEIQIGGCRILARLRQARDDPSGALEALDKAHELAREKDVSPLMRARNAACHVQIALAQGDLAMALRWAEAVTEPADGSRFYPLLGLTPARLHLAQGEKAAAAEELSAWYEVAIDAGWQFGAVEVRALEALAAPTLDEALVFLAGALELAEPEGYVRTFVDKGEPMMALLREAAERGARKRYVGQLLAAFSPAPALARARAQPLIEPLSDRELEVLQLLVQRWTNQEIAQALFISVNTVKSHLKNVYGKLGVHDRREAVVKAKELDLL